MSIEYMSYNATLDFTELKVKKEIATKMLKANEPLEKIIDFTELPKKTIEELQQKLLIKT